jgi:hypothetical protein
VYCQTVFSLVFNTLYFLNCLFGPKLFFLLRTTPFWKFYSYVNLIDSFLKSSLERILNLRLTDLQWCQSTLPIRFGGLGIRRISDICLVTVRKFHPVRFSFFCGFGRSGRPMGSTNAWGCTIVTRLSLSLILSTLPFLLVFLVGFSSFSFRLAPAEEAAGIVPLSSQFQRDGSYIPSGLSGREPWPFARKNSLFPIIFFLHGLEFIGVE